MLESSPLEEFWNSTWGGFSPPSHPDSPLSLSLSTHGLQQREREGEERDYRAGERERHEGQGEEREYRDGLGARNDPFCSTLALSDDDGNGGFSFRWHNATLHSGFPFSFGDYLSRPACTAFDDALLRHLIPSPSDANLPLTSPVSAGKPHFGGLDQDALLVESSRFDRSVDAVPAGRKTHNSGLADAAMVGEPHFCSWANIVTMAEETPLHVLPDANSTKKRHFSGSVGVNQQGESPPPRAVQPLALKKKLEVGNLKSLLVKCAQAVVSGNRQEGEELLARIWSYSCPLGSAQQRLAYYFAKSLAIRIVGTAATAPPPDNMWMVASGVPSLPCLLECFHRFRMFSPYMKLAHFISNETIAKVAAEGATRIHIVEISSPGYQQWPDLISALAGKAGCTPPPQIRVTSIVFSDMVLVSSAAKTLIERSHERVAMYAQSYGVLFESTVWFGGVEDLRAESIGRRPEEVIIVNSMYNLHVLADETVEYPSRRDAYLGFLRSLEPQVFIQAEVCAAFGAPIFLTRFREAISYLESYFDMLDNAFDVTEPDDRIHVASSFLGTIIQNVIAFEGTMRIERPQKCEQWRRKMEATGFEHVPLDVLAKEKAKAMMRRMHKDFWVGEEDNWLVMGWKGRLAHAITTWKPIPLIPLGPSSRRRKKGRLW